MRPKKKKNKKKQNKTKQNKSERVREILSERQKGSRKSEKGR